MRRFSGCKLPVLCAACAVMITAAAQAQQVRIITADSREHRKPQTTLRVPGRDIVVTMQRDRYLGKRFHVQQANSSYYVDPDADYQHQGEYRIDSNNTLLQAQRMARALSKPKARIIRSQVKLPRRAADEQTIRPHLIITKPRDLQNKPIPQVPVSPEKDEPSKLMAGL